MITSVCSVRDASRKCFSMASAVMLYTLNKFKYEITLHVPQMQCTEMSVSKPAKQ